MKIETDSVLTRGYLNKRQHLVRPVQKTADIQDKQQPPQRENKYHKYPKGIDFKF